MGVDGGDGLVGGRAAFRGGEFLEVVPEFVVNPDVAPRLEGVLSLGYVTAGPPGVDPGPERGPDLFAHVAAVLVGQGFKGGLAVAGKLEAAWSARCHAHTLHANCRMARPKCSMVGS